MLSLAALVFVVGCAVALRSLMIVGALAAVVGAAQATPIICDYSPEVRTEIERFFVYPILGAIAGWICEASLVRPKPLISERREAWKRAIPLMATVVLAVVFAALGETIWQAIDARYTGGPFVVPTESLFLVVAEVVVFFVIFSVGRWVKRK
jgi:hypothetical protein